MREVDFCVLTALVRCGDVARVGDIVVESGYGRNAVERSLGFLIGLECIVKQGWKMILTERGKIALAIAVGKRARARSKRQAA